MLAGIIMSPFFDFFLELMELMEVAVTDTHPQTHRQDRLQYTALQLAHSITMTTTNSFLAHMTQMLFECKVPVQVKRRYCKGEGGKE